MAEHSNVMGGSTANRRINCPGSLEAEKAVPDPGPSEFAERGSMLHAAMELLLTADPTDMEAAEPLLDELLGQDLGFEGHEITQELIDTKIEPALAAWFEVFDQYQFDDWFIEQRVSLETVVPGAFGTADIIAKDTEKRLHILDWKFGDGVVVPAEGNIGLGFYAACAMYEEDPELMEFCDDITGVVLHIVQPRVGDAQALYSWETSEEWIESIVNQAAAAHDKAIKPDAPLVPGSWCQFCRARPTCPAHMQMATQAISNAPESMSAIELAEAMRVAQILKTWIGDVFKLAQTELEGGASIPGWKLVTKKPRRVWADEAAAEKAMRAAKVKVGDMFTKRLISPTQAEKLNKALYAEKLSDIVVMHSSGVTVAPDSDKREAVTSATELLAAALPDKG